MKQFFKMMFASMSGCLLSGIILILIFIGIITGITSMFSSEPEVVNVKQNTLLKITLDKPMSDRTLKNQFDFQGILSKTQGGIGLNDFLGNVKKAQTDPNIKGILLDMSAANNMGYGMLNEIRKALDEFKNSGKFVVAYSDDYSQQAYYLASVANRVYINPMGSVGLTGIYSQLYFLKGLFQKLDIEPQIIRHGKYKSAIEPFILDKMSEANREQVEGFVGSIWGSVLKDISISRNISVDELNVMTNELVGMTRSKLDNSKLIDKTLYKDELENEIKSVAEMNPDEKINYVTIEAYTNAPDYSKKKMDFENKVAVVYAIGEIREGNGDDRTIGSTRISKAIKKAREDDKIKAIVLRVNSPGGSALASEIIRREVVLAKEVKPVIVSMGDVAASGGYWISCSADTILADPTTITGSIGVFGMIPNLQKFFNNKLGITFDGVKTNENADIYSIVKPLTPFQMNVIQTSIEDIYNQFIQIVAQGRNMPVSKVDSIGQGRVWSGIDALRLGLVDKMGGLDDAIAIAAESAKLKSYSVVNYPAPVDAFQELMNVVYGKNSDEEKLKMVTGDNYKYIKFIKSLLDSDEKVFARLPFEYELN